MKNYFIVLLHGPMGSGKTTVSNKINNLIQPSARIALPDLRRMLSGNRREHADITRDIMLQLSDAYLSKDIPVIVDVVCKSDDIAQYKKIAEAHRCVFLSYYIHAEPAVRWNRVCKRTAEMMDVDKIPESKVKELEPIFAENKAFYDQLDGSLGTHLDTTNLTSQQVVERICSDLKNSIL